MQWETAGWVWWGTLQAVSLLNLALLTRLLATRPARPTPSPSCLDTDTAPTMAQPVPPARSPAALRWCAAVFTLVCAYRAALPRVDVPRQCWLDTPANWPVLGRSAATVAELAWAVQMGLIVQLLGTGLHGAGWVSARAAGAAWWAGLAVVGLAVVAEGCSWTNLITESNLFAVFEQALWAGLLGLCAGGIGLLVRRWPGRPVGFIVFGVLAAGMAAEQSYEAFGLYLVRYMADQRDGVRYYGFSEGLERLAHCAVTTQDLRDWKEDAPWMTGYFSAAVWSSIWLGQAAEAIPAHDREQECRLLI